VGGRGGFKRFSGSLVRKPIRALCCRRGLRAGGRPGSGRGRPLLCGGSCCQARSKRLAMAGLESAGLRRLSRRGSWVQIPPPAPKPNISGFGFSLSRFYGSGVFCMLPFLVVGLHRAGLGWFLACLRVLGLDWGFQGSWKSPEKAIENC